MAKTIIEKEMGYSKESFFNQFKNFALQLSYTIQGQQIFLCDEKRKVTVTLIEKNNRQLGALVLPSLAVKLEFENYTSEQQTLFLHQFDRSFQRGGG